MSTVVTGGLEPRRGGVAVAWRAAAPGRWRGAGDVLRVRGCQMDAECVRVRVEPELRGPEPGAGAGAVRGDRVRDRPLR